MNSFVKINKGDAVYDTVQQVLGKVVSINDEKNIARVKSFQDEEVILCHLSSLTLVQDTQEQEDDKVYDYNKWHEQVKEFHVAFNHPVATQPTALTLERATNRSVWIVEEVLEHLQQSSNSKEEFEEAYNALLKGMEKAKEKSLKDEFSTDNTARIVGQADALIDATYFIMGSFVEMGVKPDSLFNIVQNANMSKLFTDENGNKYAKYREEDGKILKSPDFFSPEPFLHEEVLKQIKEKNK